MPKNPKNWSCHFEDIVKIPSKTWFFTLHFFEFLTHLNDQKFFSRARCQLFHVLNHQKKFCQNWAPLGQKCSVLPEYSQQLLIRYRERMFIGYLVVRVLPDFNWSRTKCILLFHSTSLHSASPFFNFAQI